MRKWQAGIAEQKAAAPLASTRAWYICRTEGARWFRRLQAMIFALEAKLADVGTKLKHHSFACPPPSKTHSTNFETERIAAHRLRTETQFEQLEPRIKRCCHDKRKFQTSLAGLKRPC